MVAPQQYDDHGRARFLGEFVADNGPGARDALELLLGEQLGSGVSRITFRSRMNRAHVVKIECGYSGQNQMEQTVWLHAYGTPAAKWLAPCHDLSPWGAVLIQDYCEPLPIHMRPDKIPAWAADTDERNWALLDGRPVIVDYGHVGLHRALASKAMRAPRWD